MTEESVIKKPVFFGIALVEYIKQRLSSEKLIKYLKKAFQCSYVVYK